MYLEIQILAGFPELEIASFANAFRRFDVPRNPNFGRFPGARNREFRECVPAFRCTSKSNFRPVSRSSKSRVSQIRSAVSMYPGIQVLRGFPELEIATSAKKFRRFGAPGNPIFGDFREQVPAFRWSVIEATRPASPIRGSKGPFPDPRFGRLGPSGPGWLVPWGSKSGLSAPNSTVFWSGNGGFWPIPRIPNYRRPTNVFPYFDVPRNPNFGRFPGARNREFREYVPVFRCTWKSRFCEASRSSKWRLPRRNSAVLGRREIQFLATSVSKFPHFDGPRFRRCGQPDLSADREVRFRTPGSADWGLPGRDGCFRGARNRGFPQQIPPFYGPEMADFGRFPGFRISDAPPTYSPVLMYLEIQLL